MIKVKSARDLGLQFTDNPHQMVGQDGAYSIALDNRKNEALWFFGDTLIGSRIQKESLWFPGGHPIGPEDMSGNGSIVKLYNNTGLILSDRTGRDGLKKFKYICDPKGNLKQLVPHEPDEDPNQIRVWCLHGLSIEDKLYLFYITVRMLREGPLPVNFEIIGSGVAEGDSIDFHFKRIYHEGSSIWWKANEPQFGSSVFYDKKENFVYIYGVRRNPAGFQQCFLARTSPDSITDKSKYQFLVSPLPKWENNLRNALPVMFEMPNEMSVSWNPHLGGYLAVHSLNLTGKIVGRFARYPYGPWSEPFILWKVNPPKLNYKIPYSHLIYAGKEHPELADDNGRTIYLTYVEFEEYFPHLVEVVLA